jgi:hypothetical protein
MSALKSLARFMQSNMEKNQKIANAAMRHSQMGGGKGSLAQAVSGEMVRVRQQGIHAVMERRSRVLMNSYWKYCDLKWLCGHTQAQEVDQMWKRQKTFEFGARDEEFGPQSPRNQVPALSQPSTSGVRGHSTLTPQKQTPTAKRHRPSGSGRG